MKFRILENTELSEEQKERIMEDICHTAFFGFSNDTDRNFSGFNGFHYITGHAVLFRQYGQYMDKIPSEIEPVVKNSPEDYKKLPDAVIYEEDIACGDDAIESMMNEQFTSLIATLKETKHDRCIIALNKEQTSPNIPKNTAEALYYMLDDADFQRKSSPHIIREAYKQTYSCSAFAPYAHCLLALKLRTKRTDAKKELHSVYFWGNLSFWGKEADSLDFSQFFSVSDYWYYEMETGVNMCMEITDVLLELSKKNVIKDTDISCICTAIKDSFHLIDQYPILTRIYLLRTCIRYAAAYMEAVRKNPVLRNMPYGYLESPIKDNDYRIFEYPTRLGTPRESTDMEFTSEQLSWVLSEILFTIETPFRSHSTEGNPEYNINNSIAKYLKIPKEYFVFTSEHKNCALAFCDLSHPYIKECIDYLTKSDYSKNIRVEKMFNKVHSVLFEPIKSI